MDLKAPLSKRSGTRRMVRGSNAKASEETTAHLGALVAQALAQRPDDCAFRFRGVDLTRDQLFRAACDVAERLQARGIAAGEPVAVECEHSFELAICMCGVSLAEGCAVPIDPSVSEERRKAILSDINPRLHITRRASACIDIEDRAVSHPAGDFAAADPNLAFIVYTSGSSGGPKGVEISQANYTSRLQHIVAASTPAPEDIDLAWTPSSFIGMLDEIFFPLLLGIPSVIAASGERTNPHSFGDLVNRENITMFRITPSLLDVYLRSGIAGYLGGVRSIFCSGETLSADVQKKANALLTADIIGFYGATEAPGMAFHVFDRAAPPLETTVCTPQPFAEFRVVGENGGTVPVGEPGEIWIAGFAVARGYWRKPELSAEKFIHRDGWRWYRTGDRGRKLADGQVEILGRADLSEVNIHGVRVSLPEVRDAMRGLAQVGDAWVSPVEPASGFDPVLVGHCVITNPAAFNPQALKETLSRLLPSPAVPRFILRHDAFPLTANGKLDLQALTREASAFATSSMTDDATSGAAPSPTTLKYTSLETEALLAVVLETAGEVLGTKGLTAQDNFFAVGGNSLLAVHLALALSEKLDVELMSTLVFNTNVFSEIATAIASGHFHAGSAIKLLRTGDRSEKPLLTLNATGHYTSLEPHLGGDYPLYNLNIFGLTNDLGDTLDSVELKDLAIRLAAHIVEFFPVDEYRLMGYCQDGCLAVETARVLQERHGATCSLLLIDTFFLDHRPTAKMILMRALELGPQYYLHKFKNRLSDTGLKDGFEAIPSERRAALMTKSQKDERLYRRYTELFMNYQPRAIDCPVVLFVSREWRHANLSSVRKIAGKSLQVKHVEGLHNTLFKTEAISHLAMAIDETVEEMRDAMS